MTSAAGPRLAVAATCVVLGLAADALGLPAAFLVAGLAVGMAAALGPVRTPTAPRGLVAAGEAVIGVSVGTVLRPGALAECEPRWRPSPMPPWSRVSRRERA